MSEIYTIGLEDQVTGNAYRIAGALTDVSVAAQYLSRSIKNADKDMIALDKRAMQVAQAELRAARAAMSAGNALAKLGPQIKSTTQAKITATGHTWKFSYALNALYQEATRTAFALAGRLASAAVDAGKALFDVADLATRAHLSFGNFFGLQGDQTLKESIDIAKRYGFTIADTIAQVNRFGAAGFNPEQSKGLLRFGADMMAAGRSVQDVKGIFLAMTQIQGKGKLQAEELTQQLAERGINAGKVWDILARKYKTTKELVMKMQKAGKITPGPALNAIVEAGVEGVHGARIGKAGEAIADATVGGLGRRMSTLIESAIFDAVDSANPALVKGMQSLFEGMSMSSTKGLQDTLTQTLNGIGQGLEKIGPQIPAMVDGFTKAFGAASGFKSANWDTFAQSLPDVAKNLGTIAGFMVNIADAAVKIGAFLGRMSTEKTTLDPVQQFLHDKLFRRDPELVTEQSQASFAVDRQIRTAGDAQIAEEAGAALASGVTKGVLDGAPSAAHAMDDLATGAIDAFKDTTQTHSPSKVFTRLGQSLSQGVALGVDSDADLAMHSSRMMAEGTIAAGAGASGLDLRSAAATGGAAGAAMSSRSAALSVRVGDVVLGGGSGESGSVDAANQVREYFETEFVSLLERHLEGVGA